MKRVLFTILLLLSSLASAQDSFLSYSNTTTGSGDANKLSGTGVIYHKLTFNGSGTISTCQVKLEQSATGVGGWTDLIAATTCTSNGVTAITTGTINYVRITISTLTGGGTMSVVYQGWITPPTTNGFVFSGVLASIPATCNTGDLAFITNATAGRNIYMCTATNTWTQQAGGTPAGNNLEAQYNNAGALGGAAEVEYNATWFVFQQPYYLFSTNSVFSAPQAGKFLLGIDSGTNKLRCMNDAAGSCDPVTTITGADTQVTFFDGANTPAGDGGLIYNKTTDALTAAGVITGLSFTGTGTSAAELRLGEPSGTGSDYTGFKAPASVTTAGMFEMPAALCSVISVLESSAIGVLTCNAVTGTGNYAKSASPAFTGTASFTSLSFSSTLTMGATLTSANNTLIRTTSTGTLTIGPTGGSAFTLSNTGGNAATTISTVGTGNVVVSTATGHLAITQTSPPVITTGCGTSGSIGTGGTDSGFTFTVGTGGTDTSCDATFIKTYTNAPACVATSDTDELALKVATTPTTVIVSKTAAFTAGSKLHVVCIGG